MEKVGDTLESIRVVFKFYFEAEITKISRYCRKLKSVHVRMEIRSDDDSPFFVAVSNQPPFDIILDRVNRALAPCLAWYGKQLEYAYLTRMNANELREVASACTDARFEVHYKKNESIYKQREILGPLFQTAYVNFREDSIHYEDIAEASNLCVNLKKLDMIAPIFNGILDLFSAPKPLLEELTLISTEISYGLRCEAMQ